MKATAGWTDEQERQLTELREAREAHESSKKSSEADRIFKLKTTKDLFEFLDAQARAQEEANRGVEKADTRIERIEKALEVVVRNHGTVVEKIEGLTKDINALAKGERETDGGDDAGIGYDHEKAVRDEDPKRFRPGRAVAGFCRGWQGRNYEPQLALLKEFYEKNGLGHMTRALELGVSSGGGLLVPPQWLSEIIGLLRPNLVIQFLGARFRPLSGPTMINKMKGGATSYWVAEGLKATQSQPSYGQIQLTPKPLVTLVPVSDDLLEMAPDGLEGDIEEDMAMSQAETLDLAVLKGDGGDGEPMGIMNLAGGTTDFASIDLLGADQNVTDLLDDLVAQIYARDVRGEVRYALHPLALQLLRTVKDANGKPLLFETAVAGAPISGGNASVQTTNFDTGILWGRPYATSTALTFGSAADDFLAVVGRAIYVGTFGLTEILPSRHASYGATNAESAYTQRQMLIRMTSKWDAALQYTEAVQIADGWDNAP